MLVTVKLRERKSPSGIRGCFARIIQIGNPDVATTPTAKARYPTGSCHARCWQLIAPKARKTMATPIQSKGAVAFSSRLSGTGRQVAQAATSTNGTLIRKAARQE